MAKIILVQAIIHKTATGTWDCSQQQAKLLDIFLQYQLCTMATELGQMSAKGQRK